MFHPESNLTFYSNSRQQKYHDDTLAENTFHQVQIDMGIEAVVKNIDAFDKHRHEYIDWQAPRKNHKKLQCTAIQALEYINAFTIIVGEDRYTADILNIVVAWMNWSNFLYGKMSADHVECEPGYYKKQWRINRENGVHACYVPDGIREYVARKVRGVI